MHNVGRTERSDLRRMRVHGSIAPYSLQDYINARDFSNVSLIRKN
jgi:hypothetical protein